MLSLRAYKLLLAILYDLLMVPCAWFVAYAVRFNFEAIPLAELIQALNTLPFVMLAQVFAFWQMGLYRGLWRFASIPDLIRIFKSVLLGSALSLLVLFLTTRLQFIPRSIFPIYAFVLVAVLGAGRLSVRWLKDYGFVSKTGKRSLIIGAGKAGESLVKDLQRNGNSGFLPILFVDDDQSKQGREIHGVRVMGTATAIPALVKRYHIECILIATPFARSSELKRLLAISDITGLSVRLLSRTEKDIASAAGNNLREVALEDLLGRDPVSLDWTLISGSIASQTVLVSGGGGSIGSELCRQIADLNPDMLIVIENSEYNLFMLEQELNEKFPKLVLKGFLTDIRDKPGIEAILKKYHPHIIFHAAAFKHVPLLETQLREAVRNNILGTWNLAEMAIKYHVKKFILVSSDKAVNPRNVMGATKRAAEIICQTFNNENQTKFMTVRFGNVLGSLGSVIPTFKQQLAKGGPITVTHPEITRFFMTIPEAVQLILQAASMGEGGEVFVLDMGEPIKIRYLAEQMIRLSGKTLGKDIEISYTGLRPGEKMFEELFHQNELLGNTAHTKILQAKTTPMDRNKLKVILAEFEEQCIVCGITELASLLQNLVPDFDTAQCESHKLIHLTTDVVV